MNIDKLKLSQLIYTVAVSESKSFREAAKITGVSQPTLSAAIMTLEDRIGFIIFRRRSGSSGAELTTKGTAFIQQVKMILSMIDGLLATDSEEPVKPDKSQFFMAYSYNEAMVRYYESLIEKYNEKDRDFLTDIKD